MAKVFIMGAVGRMCIEAARAYAKNVAIPLSIGTQFIIKGKAKVDRGCCSAYEVFDPVEFFKELEKRGIQVHERVHEYQKLG